MTHSRHEAHRPSLSADGAKVRRQGERLVALAGNPNTGKSTVFNALTGLRQHTGNWPGKTVGRAEGSYVHRGQRYRLVDLPGTYSLLSTSVEEAIARDFLLFGRPDCAVVVVDATCLQRNLNLVLQTLEVTDRVVVCLNLMDEARRRGVVPDPVLLRKELGVPVVATAARWDEGLEDLRDQVAAIASGRGRTTPLQVELPPEMAAAVERLTDALRERYPSLQQARWLALRLLDGDAEVEAALRREELPGMRPPDDSAPSPAGLGQLSRPATQAEG